MSRRALARLVFTAETVVLTLVVVLSLQVFVAQPYRVERESMLDTLHEGQMVLVDKLTPRVTGFARGDIVVFRPPAREGDDATPFIKRVIGLPGDVVELRDGRVDIDGVPLDESSYVFRGQPTEPTDALSRWVVPADGLFVLGDHRGDSTDSRSSWLGIIPLSSVIGRAALRYWPPESLAVLSPPEYPELRAASIPGPAAIAGAEPDRVTQASGPVTQVSMSRR